MPRARRTEGVDKMRQSLFVHADAVEHVDAIPCLLEDIGGSQLAHLSVKCAVHRELYALGLQGEDVVYGERRLTVMDL